MIGWMLYQAKITPPPKPPGTPSATPAVASGTLPSPPSPETVTPAAPEPPEPEQPEQTQEIDTSSVAFTFTNHGGGITRAQLKKHFVDDESGRNIALNDYGVVPVGAITFSDQPGEGVNASYTTTGTDAQGGISYQRTAPHQIQITKKFTLPTAKVGADQYIATLDLSIANRGDKPYANPEGYYLYLGSAGPVHNHDMPRYICMDWYLNGKASEFSVSSFSAGKIPLLGIQTSAEKTEYTASGDNIGWAAVYNQYFTTIVTLSPGGAKGNRIWSNRIPLDIVTHKSGPAWVDSHPPNTTPSWYAINGALGMPGFDLKPGDTYTQQFKIYLGPRQYQFLSQMDGNQVAVLHFGWFGFVSKFLLIVMIHLKKVVGSYAVAIIVLTVAIKLALWPLQNRSTQSMKKMQALTPKMTELREKYKDDPAKLNTETIKLYKTYGVNPLAGCLPMFIQLPIFFGFYSMLGAAIELRNSKFFWVHDLSQPDTAHILGFSVNILPLCMAATSVWMMSMTPKSGDSSQQKMMMFMPLIFLYICYNYASGLALYFMVSNLFSVMQFYITRNQTAPTLEKVAVAGKKKR